MHFTIRSFALTLAVTVSGVQAVAAQDVVRYRDFVMGADVATVSKVAGIAPSGAKVVHSRPAVIQELEWRPRYYSGGAAPLTDPVDLMSFKFYDDQLFMVIADYDRRRTEGMSTEDMIAAISQTYGQPVSQLGSRPFGTPTVQYGFPDTPLAAWGTDAYSVTLLRVAYPAAFRLVVAHTRLDALARTAIAAAVRQDTAEAPQRELDRQKKEAADAAVAQEKAKSENKAQFRP
ncbi:MAG TPA: hypothetical protein VM115_01910 [Vicinamibacterales bacterium]|nr:hypothetical protein [Vicinamibacterales bacterium]